MTPTLDDYAAAFDDTAPPRDPDEAWRRVERALRRRLRGPTRNLVVALLILAVSVAAGLSGIVTGWGLAVLFVLVVLPERWRARRAWRADLAAVESTGDLRALCAKQARERAAGHVASFLLLALLAAVFLVTGLVAHFLGRTPWPGVVAGLLVLAWSALELLVRLPLAAREGAILDAGD